MRWLLLVVGLLFGGFAVAQVEKIDSLKSTLSIANDTTRINTFLEIASLYRRVNLDSMYVVAQRMRSLSIKKNYKRGEARAILLMSISEWRRGNMAAGLKLGESALEISVTNKLIETQGDALNNIGLIYNYQGEYPTALKYYQQALPLAESVGSNKSIAGILNNFGGLYYNLKDYDLALDYWKKTLNYYSRTGDKASIGIALNNVGMAYADLGNFKMSLFYYFTALKKYDDKAPCGRLYPLENIGDIYLKQNKTDSAVFYLAQALQCAEGCHDPIIEMGLLTSLADTYKVTKQYHKAQTYLEKAMKIGQKAHLNRETGLAAKLLSELHEQQGHTKEALAILKIYNAIQDSLYNTENAKAIGKLEAQHEFELTQKEKEVALRIENLEKEKILTKEKWLRNTFIGGFVMMIAVAALVYRNFRRKKLSNQRLLVLNKEIKKQQKQLKKLNKSLFELNNELESRIAERTKELNDKNAELENKNMQLANYAFLNAHKLRAPVATLLGLVMLFDNQKIGDHERAEIVNKIRSCATDLNEVVREIRITLEKEKLQV